MAKSEKIRFRDSADQFACIAKDVAEQRFATLYLLMGEEGYFIDRLGEMLASNLLPEEMRAFNQTVVYGKDVEAGAVVNLCRQMPMMGGRQVVIVREAQGMRKIEQLSLYTQAPGETTVLVLCHKEKNLDKRTPLYKHIAAKGVVFESARPYDNEIGGWLSDEIRRRDRTIEPKALSMIADHLGTDLAKIVHELDKLLTFLPEGTKVITAAHVEQNIGISKDFNNFELTKALSERNRARALMIADHFARNPKDNPLLVTINAMFSHFQRIFIVNYLQWLSKHKGAPAPADSDLGRVLKVNPFFVGEYRQAAALYPNRKVFVILGLLREYDMKSKGMNTGQASDGDLLRELLLKIFML